MPYPQAWPDYRDSRRPVRKSGPVQGNGGDGWIRTVKQSACRIAQRRLSWFDVLTQGWWRGLDSNQRTLARADLQSAAFNHSATSPRGQEPAGRRAKWRRGCTVSTRSLGGSAGRRFARSRLLAALASLERSGSSACPRHAGTGAGEGNRTLVVSLEGFCSTIELHPRGAAAHCHCTRGRVNGRDFSSGNVLPP